jgi:hypothetical protein
MLLVEFENNVQDNQDTSDYSKFAIDPSVTATAASKNFQSNVVIADIVAVNGQPAKGIFFRERRTIMLTPNPTPGQAIADVTRNFSGFETVFEILQPDGTPIGTIKAVVDFRRACDGLVGAARGAGEEVPLAEVTLDGSQLSWKQAISKPMRLNLAFAVTVDGDTLTGTSRAGRLPASKVTGQRRASANAEQP